MSVETCIVDNRTFLLGLDELYREAMKEHERKELLSCARNTAAILKVQPNTSIPIEGYYDQDELLTEYFLLVRGLQEVPRERASEVEGNANFKRLEEVTSSPIFGRAIYTDKLLPKGRDPLAVALRETLPDWSVNRLLQVAHDRAAETDEFSLVGLGALTKDPVVLTALRESVVLYAELVLRGRVAPKWRFIWDVDPKIASRAQRFIDTFNDLFGETLPDAIEQNAEPFWKAGRRSEILGRCVRIGLDDSQRPVRHYHWAIQSGAEGLEVTEFWDTEIWTTKRFRKERGYLSFFDLIGSA